MYVSMETIAGESRQAKHKASFREHMETNMTDNEREKQRWLELREWLDQNVNRLPSKLREVILLHYLQGKNQEEIASIIGCSYVNVRTRLSRARDKLRELLSAEGHTVSGVALVRGLQLEGSCRPPVEVLDFIWQELTSHIWGGSGGVNGAAQTADKVMKAMRMAAVKKAAATASAVLLTVGAGSVGGWAVLERLDQSGRAAEATAIPRPNPVRWSTDFESDRLEDWEIFTAMNPVRPVLETETLSGQEGRKHLVRLERRRLGGRESRVMVLSCDVKGLAFPSVRHKGRGGTDTPRSCVVSYDLWWPPAKNRPGAWKRHAVEYVIEPGREQELNVRWIIEGTTVRDRTVRLQPELISLLLTQPPWVQPWAALLQDGGPNLRRAIIDNLQVRDIACGGSRGPEA